MTVKVRQWKRGKRVGFEVDIRFTYPDGTPFRRRIKAPVESKSAAKRWGEAKERELLMRPSPIFLEQQEEKRKEVPTLKEFKPKYMENYSKANREKASSLHGKERIFDNHLLPRLGDKRLDQITNEDVQALKGALAERKPKTVNNVLTVLGSTLRVAVKWKPIAAMPCSIDLLKVSNHKLTFYEFDEYAQPTGGRTDRPTHARGRSARRRCRTAARRDPRAALVRRRLCPPPAARAAGGLAGHHRHAEGRPRSHRSDDRCARVRPSPPPSPSRRARALRRWRPARAGPHAA
jgi:hypothetical protein